MKFVCFLTEFCKFWKISSVSTNWHDENGNSRFTVELDGIELAPQDRYQAYNPAFSVAQMPIWLSEGKHFIRSFRTGGGRVHCVINGIEFNVVQ
jgi:hypothetical protein